MTRRDEPLILRERDRLIDLSIRDAVLVTVAVAFLIAAACVSGLPA